MYGSFVSMHILNNSYDHDKLSQLRFLIRTINRIRIFMEMYLIIHALTLTAV